MPHVSLALAVTPLRSELRGVALRLGLRTLASLASLRTLVVSLPSAVLVVQNYYGLLLLVVFSLCFFGLILGSFLGPFLTPFLTPLFGLFLSLLVITQFFDHFNTSSLYHFIINLHHQLTHNIIKSSTHVKIVILGSFLTPRKTTLF
jgi:hypothetical protein